MIDDSILLDDCALMQFKDYFFRSDWDMGWDNRMELRDDVRL